MIRLERGGDFWQVEQQDRFLFIREGDGTSAVSENTKRFMDSVCASEALLELVATKTAMGFVEPSKSDKWQLGPITEDSMVSLVKNSVAVDRIDRQLAAELGATVARYSRSYDRMLRLAELAKLSGFSTTTEVSDWLLSNEKAVISFGVAWKRRDAVASEFPPGRGVHLASVLHAALSLDGTSLRRFLIEAGIGLEAYGELSKLVPINETSALPQAIAIANDVGPLPKEYMAFLSSSAPKTTFGEVTLYLDYFELFRAYKGYLSWFDVAGETVEAGSSLLDATRLLPIGAPSVRSSNHFLLNTAARQHGAIYLWRHDERGCASHVAENWIDFVSQLLRSDKAERPPHRV